MNIKTTQLYRKALRYIVGGVIGDALGTPSEGMDYKAIDDSFGWIDDFDGVGTDATIMKNLLAGPSLCAISHASKVPPCPCEHPDVYDNTGTYDSLRRRKKRSIVIVISHQIK